MKFDFCKDIILVADDFYNAYLRCSEGRNPKQVEGTLVLSVLSVPAIVNGAFAIELYFKSMLPPKTRGHELEALYDILSNDIKCEIKQSTIPQLELLAWGKTFEEFLENINKVFEDWRYIHEKDYAIGYLGNRINEYHQVFEILLPKIREIAHKHNATQEDKNGTDR